jgi:hypothetical protein
LREAPPTGRKLPGSQPDLVSSCRLHVTSPDRQQRAKELHAHTVAFAAAPVERRVDADSPVAASRAAAAADEIGHGGAGAAVVARVSSSGPPSTHASLSVRGGGTSNPAFHGSAVHCGNGEGDDAEESGVEVVDVGPVVGESSRRRRRSPEQLIELRGGGGQRKSGGRHGSLGRIPVWPDQPTSSSCTQAGKILSTAFS